MRARLLACVHGILKVAATCQKGHRAIGINKRTSLLLIYPFQNAQYRRDPLLPVSESDRVMHVGDGDDRTELDD